MRIIGLCRFSYPALGGFKRMHDSIAEREAYLYNPERMELRFRHFETLTLPSIQAQQDEDFTFLIMIGENMPRPDLERLQDLVAPVPQIKIVHTPVMKHRHAAQMVILSELGEDRPESIQFRLDDDDAVGVDFVRLIRRRAHQTARMRKNWRNMVFEFKQGYSVKLSSEGIRAHPVKTNFLSCGLAAMFRPEDKFTIMNYGHHKLHQTMPTMVEPEPTMYLRAFHDDNDSRDRVKEDQLQLLSPKTSQLFKDRFNVDDDQVRSVFSAPVAPRETK
ncbi:glycosyltransferase [Roseovarius sp. EL26]|uniref:glycosyltransferase n=1 Tax=Roseovarius sp. EL26 TaxID=2126672 RepID=UPI000EA201EC|nr:glycosyltransferase [Roseovarius sp. EL26]